LHPLALTFFPSVFISLPLFSLSFSSPYFTTQSICHHQRLTLQLQERQMALTSPSPTLSNSFIPTHTSNRSSSVDSFIRDSPRPRRQKSTDLVASASAFVGREGYKLGKKGYKGKSGGVIRLVVLTAIAIGLLVMAERSWNGEESLFRSGRDIDESVGLSSMEVKDETRINKALDHDSPYDQHRKPAELEAARNYKPKESVDRWIKITRPAPARLDNPPAPSRPSPEINIGASPRTFDASQRFIFVGWMGEQVRFNSILCFRQYESLNLLVS